jgi:hypothetical protein
MKTWKQLSKKERVVARNACVVEVLEALCIENAISLTNEDAAKAFQAAIDEVERLHTPWFLAEAVMGNELLRSQVETIALQWAKHTIWSGNDEVVRRLPTEGL